MSKEKNKYGQKITLAEAQTMINEYELLERTIEKRVKEEIAKGPDVSLKAKSMVFLDKSQQYNAFVFTKDLIMRFFDGSEEDDDGNPHAANYLVVILGAHKNAKTVNDQNYEAGSFTVLTAGCTKRTETGKDGKETIKFYPLSVPEAANEYPPRTIVNLQPGKEEKGIDNIGFDYLQVI